jgi:hypothetical protein
MNNTLRMNKFNKFGGSKKKKGGTGKGLPGKKKNKVIPNSDTNSDVTNLKIQGNSVSNKAIPPSSAKPSNNSSHIRTNTFKITGTPVPSGHFQSDLPEAGPPATKKSKTPKGSVITQTQYNEPKTKRTISLFDTNGSENFIEKLLIKNNNYFNDSFYNFSFKCDKKDGTPQKRLLYLAIACLNILDGFPFVNYGYKKITEKKRKEYQELINFMNNIKEDENNIKEDENNIKEDENEVANSDDARRGWWDSNVDHRDSLNELVNTIVIPIEQNKSSNWQPDLYNKIICSFQLIILVKSISDTSQFGQLVNFIPNLISPREHNTENANISNIIKRDAKIGFDSADKICIGTSAILVDALPFPVTTMCPRKCSMGGRNIQNIIIQKGIIAALAITINILWNEERISASDASELLSNYYDFNNEDIIKFINNLLKIITDFKENHIKSKFQNFKMNDLYNYGFKIKLRWEEDEVVSNSIFLNYETDYVFKKLSDLTKNIKNLLNNNTLDFLATARDKLFTKKKTIWSSIWIYYLSNDVFKLIYPQSASFGIDDDEPTQKKKTEGIKDLVSKHEILMGTIDSTYGHDFEKIECIQQIGERFMEGDDLLKNFILPSSVVKKNEKAAMIMCLKKSNCVTIDQLSDMLRYNFNSDENYLISNTEVSSCNYLNIFDSIFAANKELVVSVDLVKGFQIPLVNASAMSFKIVNDVKAENPLINPIDPNEMQEIVYKQIQQNGYGGEFRGSTNEFDGAGNYNTINPIIDANDNGELTPYETKYTYKFSILQKNGEYINNEFSLKINTNSTVTVKEIEKKFKDNLISSFNTPTDAIFQILTDNYGLEKEKVLKILKNDKYNGFIALYSELFNKIKLGKNGNMKITTEDISYFITGCKIFIKENNQNIPDQYKNFCDSIKKISSKLNKDSAIANFNSIIANIIRFLYENQIQIDSNNQLQSNDILQSNKIFLIHLFTGGVENFTKTKIKPNDNSEPIPSVFGFNPNRQITNNNLLNNEVFSSLFSKKFYTTVTTPNTHTLARGETDPTGATVYKADNNIINIKKADNNIINEKNTKKSFNEDLDSPIPSNISTLEMNESNNSDDEEIKKGGKKLKKTRRPKTKKNKLTKRKH